MAATAAAFGIADSSAATLCQSYEVDKKLEERVITASDATFGKAHAFDPVIEFSVKVRDSIEVLPGVGAAGLAAVSGGKTLILSVKSVQKCDDYEDCEYSGKNYPGAS